MRAKKTVNGNRVGEDEEKKRNQGAFMGEKEEKGEGRGGTDGGGMKGNGDNVWENTRKEERNEVARLYTGRHLIPF